jgi:hypothetical protein
MPEENLSDAIIIDNVDLSHIRLVELSKLADQAKPFYSWVENIFQQVLQTKTSLDETLQVSSKEKIANCLEQCYSADQKQGLPLLFDGIGRSYPHQKACYYFFSWIVRDAPKQRLEPLIQRIIRQSKRRRVDVEIQVLAALIHKYRQNLRTFSWDAVREVILDRLEGSRRSISGHERETVVRTALLTAVQKYFADHSHYGVYAKVEIPARQIKLGNETYDVSARLIGTEDQEVCEILVPVKTRETEGGGHSHLFTRDIMSAINAVRSERVNSYIVAVIVAKNWAVKEAGIVREKVDHAAIFDLSPNQFQIFDETQQDSLNLFIAQVLDGTVKPKQVSRG